MDDKTLGHERVINHPITGTPTPPSLQQLSYQKWMPNNKDEKCWPLMPLLPSYRYEREHPRPWYENLIYNQEVRVPIHIHGSKEISVRNVTFQIC
jgi:hypothetical protein